MKEWVKETISKWTPNHIWQVFKESMIFAVIKACLLIAVLTYLIFAIKPKQAHIVADFSELDIDKTSLTADEITLTPQGCKGFTFSSKDAVYFRLPNCEIKELPFVPNHKYTWLAIYPGDDQMDYDIANILISITGQMDSVRLSNVHLFGKTDYLFAGSKCEFVGPVKIEIGRGKAVLETQYGDEVEELDNTSFTMIPDTSDGTLDGEQLFEVELDNSLFKENGNFWNREAQSIIAFIEYEDGSLQAERIDHFESRVTGNLALSYTPTPQEYDLNKQELILENKTNTLSNLDFDYNVKRNKDDGSYSAEGAIYGYVSNGEISEMSLFPSFQTWFYSNAYMTPTAIVSIVLTAIALINKKKEDESNK